MPGIPILDGGEASVATMVEGAASPREPPICGVSNWEVPSGELV